MLRQTLKELAGFIPPSSIWSNWKNVSEIDDELVNKSQELETPTETEFLCTLYLAGLEQVGCFENNIIFHIAYPLWQHKFLSSMLILFTETRHHHEWGVHPTLINSPSQPWRIPEVAREESRSF